MVTSKKKVAVRCGTVFTAAALALPLLSFVGTGTASAAKVANDVSFPRQQTLYTSGTMYSPPTNFNPLDNGSRYAGTMGLVYEPLFLYNPITNGYIPWLATAGKWSGSSYIISVRNGVTWSDGSPLTGADVAFSIGLAKTNPAVAYSNLAPNITGVTANGNTVTVNFTSPPPYTAWQNYLWNQPVLQKSTWSAMSNTDQVTAANLTPVGTGPMTLITSTTGSGSTEACYQDNPNWWAISQLHISFKFKYLCDQVNGSNNVELSNLVTNQIDWSNNFLPGISSLISGLHGTGGYGLRTFYKTTPYMLSANTAWLELNTSKAPMNNVNFRRAVADAVNPDSIVNGVYTGIVKAANPVGLLPNLNSFVNSSVVSKYGFSYNPGEAKMLLKESGYKGQTLTLQVPDGWTDWMAAIQIISQQLNAVGIKVSPVYPSANDRTTNMTNGTYDMLIDNNAGPDSTPWSYFNRVYRLPIGGASNEEANGDNIERYSDPTAWALVQKAAVTPTSNTAALNSIYSQIETRFLQSLPEIPLWYNGAWFQGQTQYWQNYPSWSNASDRYTPVMWFGWLGAMTTVLALANLKAA
jgi:peptide/nickel transport system substrate-binding protein